MDAVLLEQTIRAGIRDIFAAIPLVQTFCKLSLRERFPESDETDIAVSTVVDPSNADLRFTSIIQICLPAVSEKIYTDETYTQLTFEYPISFDMAVVDEWDNADGSLTYTNSFDLFIAVYMKMRAAMKASKTIAGFENSEHEYLQMNEPIVVEDEETGGRMITASMTLVVHVKGVNV